MCALYSWNRVYPSFVTCGDTFPSGKATLRESFFICRGGYYPPIFSGIGFIPHPSPAVTPSPLGRLPSGNPFLCRGEPMCSPFIHGTGFIPHPSPAVTPSPLGRLPSGNHFLCRGAPMCAPVIHGTGLQSLTRLRRELPLGKGGL